MNQDLENKIDLYLRGELNSSEFSLFEKEMQDNDELRTRVNQLQSFKESYSRKDLADLHEKLEDLDNPKKNEQPSTGKIRQIERRKILAIAASIAVIFTLIILLQKTDEDDQLALLFKENSPFKNEMTRGVNQPFAELHNLFLENKYALALNKIENVLATESDFHPDIKKRLIHGKAYALIGLEQCEKASELLSESIDCYSIWLNWIITKKCNIGDAQKLRLDLSNKECLEFQNTAP